MTARVVRERAMNWTNQYSASPPVVLVGDPDDEVRAFVRAALGEIGLAVLEARDATEVRRWLHKKAVNLVFAEVMLPHTTGDKLAGEIVRRGIPVVLMSGHPDGLRRAKEGRRLVLWKPLQIKDVLRVAILALPSWRRHV